MFTPQKAPKWLDLDSVGETGVGTRSMACAFVEEVPEITIRDGVVHFEWADEHKCMPLGKYRLLHARATIALEEHDRGNVIEFPRPSGRRRKRRTDDEIKEG